MRTHFSDPGPRTDASRPFAYLHSEKYGKLGYPSQPAATRLKPKRTSTEILSDKKKSAEYRRHSTEAVPGGRRRSALPPPITPSMLGSQTSIVRESPNLTPVENVRLPPWPASQSRASLEQVARASLQRERPSLQMDGASQRSTPQHTPRSSTGPQSVPRSTQLSPRAPNQPLPAVPPQQRVPPQQPVLATRPLTPRQLLDMPALSTDLSARPFSYASSGVSLTPPSSRGPSPYPLHGSSPSAGEQAPPRQLSLPVPEGITPPSSYPPKRYSADQLPARGAPSASVQSLPFGAQPVRLSSSEQCSNRRGSEEILRRASDQDLPAPRSPTPDLAPSPALVLVTPRTPSPGTSSASSSSWPLPTPLADPASTPPVRGRPLPGTPGSAPATPTLVPSSTGQSVTSAAPSARPLPTPPSPKAPKLPLPKIPGPPDDAKAKHPAGLAAAGDAPPPYTDSLAAAPPEKTRAPGMHSRTASGSRQACVYKPSARPGQQYAL